MSIRMLGWRCTGGRTGWLTMLRTASGSDRKPLQRRASQAAMPDDGLPGVWRWPPIALRYVTPCQAPGLWICGQPPSGVACRHGASEGGWPQLHRRIISARQRAHFSIEDAVTRFHRGILSLVHASETERERSGQITSYINRTG